MNKHHFFSLLFFAGFCGLLSCGRDRLQLDKISDQIEIAPHYILPVLQTDITLGEMLKEKKDTVEHYAESPGGDSLIRIYHAVDSLYTIKAEDYLEQLPVIKPSSKKHVFGLFPSNGTYDDETDKQHRFERMLDIYFDSDVKDDYLRGAVAGTRTQTKPTNENNIIGEDLPFPSENLRSGTFAQGTLTLIVTNNYDVDAKFHIALIEDLGGWKHVKREFPDGSTENVIFEFDNFVPKSGGVDSVTIPAEGISVTDLTGKLGYYFVKPYTVLGSKDDGIPANMDATLDISLHIDSCRLTKGEISSEYLLRKQEQQEFDSDTSVYFNVDVYKGKKLTELFVQQGELNYTVTSTFNTDIEVTLDFPSISKDGQPLPSQPIIIQEQSVDVEGAKDLENFVIELEENKNDGSINNIPLDIHYKLVPNTKYIPFDSSNTLDITFQNVDSLLFNWVRGNLEVDTINIEEESLDYNLSEAFKDFYDGEIVFTDPRLQIYIDNSAGIGGVIDLYLEGQNYEGRVMPMFHEGKQMFPIESPDYLGFGQYASTVEPIILNDVVKLDKSNSKIVDFISIMPEKLNYYGRIITNYAMVGHEEEINNFLPIESSTNIGVEAELPLQFTMKDFTIRKHYALTISDDLSVGGADIDNIQNLEVYFNVKSHFPLDIKIIYKLLRSDTTVVNDKEVIQENLLDTLHVSFLKSAKPDVIGKVGRDAQKEYNDQVILSSKDGSLLDNLLDANIVETDIVFTTADGGEKPIKLYTHYKLEMGIMIGVKGVFKKEPSKP